MLKHPVLRVAALALVIAGIGFFGLVRCIRDNPLDPKGKDYIPGTPPVAVFTADTVTGFIWDSIAVSVVSRDTQALGGVTPSVTMLFFNWFGNSANLNDSVSVAGQNDTATVFKIFWLVLPNNKAYVRARDNDGNLSPLDSMWITVDMGRPRLDSASASADTISRGDSVIFTAAATDTNGTIRDYVWTVDGTDTATTAGILQFIFASEGPHTVIVRARDNDWIFSLPDTLPIQVIDRTGPEIDFWSHHDGDTVSQVSSTITMMVRTRDPSGIYMLLINNTTATRLDTSAYPAWQTWQMNITLTDGNNIVTAWSWDYSSGRNQSRDTITIFYRKPDNVPPAIVFSTPQPGDTIRDTLTPSPTTIRVSVSDPSGVAWVRCNDSAMTNTSGNNYTINIMLNEGSDSLDITAQDGKGNDTSSTLYVTYLVFRDNTPPTQRIASPPAGRQIAADSVMTIVYANDTSGPVRSGMASVTVNGVVAVLNYGHYMATVPLVYGYDTLRSVAVDSSGNQKRDSVIVIRNRPPQFVPNVQIKDTTLWKDTTASIPLCGTDPEGSSLTFYFITRPLLDTLDTARIVPAVGGCVNIIGYQPAVTGLDTFRVQVRDSLGGGDTLIIRATIIEKPTTKPYFTTSNPPDTAILDSLYSVQLTAIDPNDSPLVYSLISPPTPSGVSITGDSGLVTWTPAALGRDTIMAMVANSIPESDTLMWIVTVVLRNMPPELATRNDTTIYEGQILQFTVIASDTNSDSLFYSFGPTYPTGAVLDSSSGLFSWTPGYKQGTQAGSPYTTVFVVTERLRSPALSDSMTVIITVRDTNLPPVITDPGSWIVNEGSALTFPLQAADINGDSITFSAFGLPVDSGASIVNGNTFTWTPSVRAGGRYPITYIATDNGSPSLSDSVTDSITVVDATVPQFEPHQPIDTILCEYPYISIGKVKADDGDNDFLIYRKLIGPDSLFVDSTNGNILWMPKKAGLNERVLVSVTAEDPYGNRDTLDWTILVARWPRIKLTPLGSTPSNDTGFSVIQMSDGGYAVCGTIADTAAVRLFRFGFFMRTDSSGNPIVAPVFYPGSANNLGLYSMQQTRDGGFIMCGTDMSSVVGINAKMVLLKTDANGTLQWLKPYSDMAGTYPLAGGRSVCLTSDNGFIACGTAARTTVGPMQAAYDGYAVKTDALGNFQWQKIYQNGMRASALENVQETIDGGFVMCGEIRDGILPTSSTDAYVVRTVPLLGDTVWTRAYPKSGTSEYAYSVAPPVAGRPEYIIGGASLAGNMAIQTNGILMKILEGGDTVWTRTLPVNTAIISVKATTDNDYIACGLGLDGSSGGTKGADALLYRFMTDGAMEWMKFHGAGLNDGGFAVTQTADGGFAVTGFATTIIGGITTDIFLAKTDKMGDLELVFDGIH